MQENLDFLDNDKPKNEAGSSGVSAGTMILIVGMLSVMLVLGLQLFRQNQTHPTPGEMAPNFILNTYAGETYELADLRGTIVVLNIWANWCPPCHAEAEDLQAVWEDYADDGVLFLGANYLEIDSVAQEFIDQYSISYPNGSDREQQIAEAYNFQAPPETFIIDRDGRIARVFIGEVTYDQLTATLDQLLEGDS